MDKKTIWGVHRSMYEIGFVLASFTTEEAARQAVTFLEEQEGDDGSILSVDEIELFTCFDDYLKDLQEKEQIRQALFNAYDEKLQALKK